MRARVGKLWIVWVALMASAPVLAHDEGPPHHRGHWDDEHRKADVRRDVAWHSYEGAQTLASEGMPEDALALIDVAIKLDPRAGRFQLTRGFVLRDMGRITDAMMALREAQRLSTGWVLEEASEELAHLQEKASAGAAPQAAAGGPEASAPAAGGAGAKTLSASLYKRLGEEAALSAVVDELLARVGADERINAFFKGADMAKLKERLVEMLGQATGGPQIYKGRSMKEVHTGMKISDADFDALVEDLVGALDKFKVPAAEKKELLEILGPMRADIVEVKGKGK